MKFSYSPLPGVSKKAILAPMVPLTLKWKGNEFPTFALVDSGAAGAVISTVIANELNLNWREVSANVGFTMSGEFRSYLVENIDIEIGDTSFTTSINVIEGISPYRCILGQRDLFKKAKVIFEGYINQFEIIFKHN